MANAIGIINLSSRSHDLEGLGDYRPAAAVSFLGRYRLIDFQISNFTNSDIERIHIHCNKNPKSIVDHVGTGRHYKINSKKGKVDIFYHNSNQVGEIYNHDINALKESLRTIKFATEEYVIIAPGHALFRVNYEELLAQHIASGMEISLLYKNIDKAHCECVGCDRITFNDEGYLKKIHKNRGDNELASVSLETYILKRETLIDILESKELFSAAYWFRDVVSHIASTINVNLIEYKGFFRNINSLREYYRVSMELLCPEVANEFFDPNHVVYTKTNDSQPTLYLGSSSVKKSLISNGCVIKGKVESSILGRNVIVEEGAQVINSVILANAYVGKDVCLKNVIVDKQAKIINVKEISRDSLTYIKRDDVI